MSHQFENLSLPELLAIILSEDDNSDEAMWYVLSERMKPALHSKYQQYKEGLWDDFEDLLDDFFLYLKEGKGARDNYISLRSIRNSEAFDKWLLSTWRFFLSAHVEEGVIIHTVDDVEVIEEEPLPDERKIEIVSQLIAYCDQVFTPRGRFVFLRTLLTLLDKQNALPEKDIAEALGMSGVSYRVATHRLKADVKGFMAQLLNDESLDLDDKHKEMSKRINNSFDGLYGVLMTTYEEVLMTLNQRNEVMALRLAHIKPDGMMLHENNLKEYQMAISAFWDRLKQALDN